MKIKALWIDDQPNQDFMVYASASYGIKITVKQNVDDGIHELETNKGAYDCVILDANCVFSRDSRKVTMSALNYALNRLRDLKANIPWFIYSAGGLEGDEASIENASEGWGPRTYDAKLWYRKPQDMDAMLQKIQEVCNDGEAFKIRAQHPHLFEWYPHPDKLLEILGYLNEGATNSVGIFNLMRKELEFLKDLSYDLGLLENPLGNTEITEWSKKLGDKNFFEAIVPVYIQRSLHSVTAICHAGSHDNSSVNLNVPLGIAPYLVKSTVFEFLNIIDWMSRLKNTPADIENRRAQVIRVSHTFIDNQTQTENEA